MRISDWSSDVCSSDLLLAVRVVLSGEVGERDDLRKCADSVGIRQRLKSDGDIGATCSAGVAPRHRVELTDRFYPVGLVRVVGHFGYLLVAWAAWLRPAALPVRRGKGWRSAEHT